MISRWSLSDSESLQVSRTLLSILVDLNNAVIWMVSTRPLISKYSSPCINPLVSVPLALITIGIIVTFMFHSFSIPKQGPDTNPSFSFLSILLCGLLGQQGPRFGKFSICLLIIIWSGRLAEIRWSVCISKFQRRLCASFFRTGSGLCIYHLFVRSYFSFLHNSQWITLPTESCLDLYSFCVNLQHLLIMWLIISSISPHNLHLLHLIYSCFDTIGPYNYFYYHSCVFHTVTYP